MNEDYGYQVRRLETQAGGMESELRALRSKLEEAEDLEHELHRVRDDLRSFEDDLGTVRGELSELDDDVRSDIRDTEQALKRLTGRVQALEAHLLAAGGAPLADLDTVDPQWKQLAQSAARGWNARSGLLTEYQRDAHRLKARQYEAALAERDEHRDKVMQAAGILASTPRSSREFKQAATDFAVSRPLAEKHDQRARKLADTAESAQAALDQDDALRKTKTSLIEQGEKAERKLNWLLRGRLADAIRDRAVLPMWFVTALGPVPPARKTQEWMELAAQVLAYRVTYEITDQVVALGAKPGTYVQRRTEWHRELTEGLRRW
ncbi:hypothetical protein [Streptomyces sp. SPB074]|uniref:hypothetical protein n=1 Tax=Streptomyces sp. (strain SPB074) TaxID=465543 RepID=UPI00017F0EDD|nr:hypothetical protein [Streptomyces sp. SPB074]